MINIHKFYSEKVNAITHVAPHHADEVFATAMLSILFPVELLRTRDQEIIKNTKAIVYDVGGEFDPIRKRFDHHQKSFSEIRDDGISYSSAGLIWREYGASIVKSIAKTGVIDDVMTAEVVSLVDEALIRGIDARDNGQGEKGDSMSVSSVISACNSLWDENEDADMCFLRACDLATAILVREIKVAISTVRGRKLVADKISLSAVGLKKFLMPIVRKPQVCCLRFFLPQTETGIYRQSLHQKKIRWGKESRFQMLGVD